MSDLDGSRKPVVVTPADEKNSQFSPDGRWITYETNASGRYEVVVQAFPDGGRLQSVSRAGGTQPRWRADSREIYFVAPGGMLMAAPVTVADEKTSRIEIGMPVALFQTRIVEGGAAVFRPQYDVTRDGHFLIAQSKEASAVPLTLILNWQPRR